MGICPLAKANHGTLWLFDDGSDERHIIEDAWFRRAQVCIDGFVPITKIDDVAASIWHATANKRDDLVIL